MNYAELRDYLASFTDTPANRTELRRMLIAGKADEVAWGYAEYNVAGFLKWNERQSLIDEAIRNHNDYDSGEKFELKELVGADLSDTNLYDAKLSGADLRNANLREADLTSANLDGANLGGANLGGAYLFGANLRNADLSGADLSGADLYSVDLRGANLSGADLRSAGYDAWTLFPEGFDPVAAEMELVE